jgi:hypothetical protein
MMNWQYIRFSTALLLASCACGGPDPGRPGPDGGLADTESVCLRLHDDLPPRRSPVAVEQLARPQGSAVVSAVDFDEGSGSFLTYYRSSSSDHVYATVGIAIGDEYADEYSFRVFGIVDGLPVDLSPQLTDSLASERTSLIDGMAITRITIRAPDVPEGLSTVHLLSELRLDSKPLQQFIGVAKHFNVVTSSRVEFNSHLFDEVAPNDVQDRTPGYGSFVRHPSIARGGPVGFHSEETVPSDLSFNAQLVPEHRGNCQGIDDRGALLVFVDSELQRTSLRYELEERSKSLVFTELGLEMEIRRGAQYIALFEVAGIGERLETVRGHPTQWWGRAGPVFVWRAPGSL